MKEQIEAVQRMQDYIKQHLYEKITLAELAEASMFSPWYAHRLFKQYTEKSPAEYIRRLRLSESAIKLRDEYSKRPVPIYLFTPYRVEQPKNERSHQEMENVRNVYIQVVEKPARKVIIKRGVTATEYFKYCEEVGCDVWGLLTSIKSISGEPVCLWLPKAFIKKGTSEYVQGVEVPLDYSGAVPEGFEVIEFPAAKYLMFQGEPFEEEHYGEAIAEIWDAIKKYNPSVSGYTWDESNPRIQLEPRGERGYIELVAIK